MSGTRSRSAAFGAATRWRQAPPSARAGWLAGARRLMTAWRERQRQRRELSLLSERDFRDMAVPTSLAVDEMRRWPWQKPSPQWLQLEELRRDAWSNTKP